MVPPPTLFYSRLCRHCAALLADYQEPAARAGVQLVCVDERLDRVPPIVTKVPALVVPSEKVVLFAGDIRKKLNRIISPGAPQGGAQAHATPGGAHASPIESQGNTAEVFSFLHGAHLDQAATAANRVDDNYANPFTQTPGFNALTEPEDTTPSEKISSSSLTSFAAQRDADMADIARRQPRPPTYNVI